MYVIQMFSTGVLTEDNMMPSFSTIANVDCGHPRNIQFGTVNVSEGTKLHARIHYTCDRGYSIYHISYGGYRLIGTSYRTCSSYGAWSGWEPTCEGMHVWVITSRAFTSGTMSAHTTQHHYIGIIDQWK